MISRRLKATWMATSLISVLILSILGNFVAAQCYETENSVPTTVQTTSTTTTVTDTATATNVITTTTATGTTTNPPTAKTDGKKKPTVKTEAEGPKKVIRTSVGYSFTEDEIRMLQQVVYKEAGGVSVECQVECQQAVCSVIINSMMVNHLTLYEEISAVNRYEVFPDCLYCEPSEETCNSVLDVLYNGTTLPRNVLYFRKDHYSDFGYGNDEPYCSIDNIYFSLDNQVEA